MKKTMLIGIIIGICNQPVYSDLLGDWTYELTGWRVGLPPAEVSFQFAIGSFETDEYSVTFGPFSESDVGTTIIVNAGNDPAFDTLASALTNGETDWVWLRSELSNPGRGEFYAFPVVTELPSGTDFQGYNIESVSFTLESLLLPLEGTGYNKYLRTKISVYGSTIPEPSSAALIVVIVSGLIFIRKRLII